MEKRNAGRSHFGSGLLVYIFLFLLVSAGVLIVFWMYLGAYEASRSNNCVREFLSSGADGNLSDGWEDSFAALDSRLAAQSQQAGARIRTH